MTTIEDYIKTEKCKSPQEKQIKTNACMDYFTKIFIFNNIFYFHYERFLSASKMEQIFVILYRPSLKSS